MAQETFELVCFGEPLYELSQSGDGRTYSAGIGGDTLNCAVAAARQGARVAHIGALGDDRFGREIRALWDGEGIDHSSVHSDQTAATGLYIISHGPGWHEFSYYRAGSASTRVTPDMLPEGVIAGAKMLHLSGISHAISDSAREASFTAMEIARAAGVTVSYDTNLRLKLWPLEQAREVIHRAACLSDIVLPGLDDARQLTGLSDAQDIARFYQGLGAKIVAITLGPEGALVLSESVCETVPGFKVRAVDATAAGDTFDGAFLAEMMCHNDPFKAARYANAAAALSTLGYGATTAMPTRAEVEKFIELEG